MKSKLYKALASVVALTLTLSSLPALAKADEQLNNDDVINETVSDNELDIENVEVVNEGKYSEEDGKYESSGWDDTLFHPDWSFNTSQTQLFKTRKIYLVKDKITNLTLTQNLCCIKIENKDICRLYDPEEEHIFTSEKNKNVTTYFFEYGYGAGRDHFICGDEIGRTTIKAYANTLGKGDIAEVIVVEPTISVDADDSYEIGEDETFSFDVDYSGDFGIATSDDEVCDFSISGKTVTVKAKSKGEVTFKLVQLKDDLTYSSVYSAVKGSTPESKAITVNVDCDHNPTLSASSVSLKAGESKDIVVNDTHKGVTDIFKQTTFAINNSTGNKKVADITISPVSNNSQKVTVKAASDLTADVSTSFSLKDTCTGKTLTINLSVAKADGTVAPTTNPTAKQTPTPTKTPAKKMCDTVTVKKTASTISVKKGKTAKITSFYKVSDKSKVSKITCKSSNTKIAKITSSKVKGVKKGSCKLTVTITFKDKSTKKISYTVKVK